MFGSYDPPSPNWFMREKGQYEDRREIPDHVRSWEEHEKDRQKREAEKQLWTDTFQRYNNEYNTLFNAITTINDYLLTHYLSQVENIFFEILQDDVWNYLKNECKPTLACTDFLQSATNLINTCRNKEAEDYQTKVTTAREQFTHKANELEKYLSPTCWDRFRGIACMFLGALIKVATLGCASSATAREGYHLFFGKGKATLTTFKNQLVTDTNNIVKSSPSRSQM